MFHEDMLYILYINYKYIYIIYIIKHKEVSNMPKCMNINIFWIIILITYIFLIYLIIFISNY